jgi:hypothetical protein
VGTEQTGVPENKRALSQWIVPPGAAQGPLWTRELGEEYKAQVLKTYLEVMLPDIYIFTRSQSGLELMKAHEDLLLQGKVGLFHTSSRPEPEDASQIAGRYEIYRQYCRTGHTLGYTEPEKNSWTKNGTPRWCSPPQWNYWRCLCQMDLGVAYVAAYANDVNMAFRGEFNANVKTTHQTGKVPAYQEEFRKAYEFCNVYAGYHALPAISPGAWIAFREGTHMKGDYTMHMSRITPDETSAPPTQTPVGPETSRYGAFARYLPAGKAVRLKLDEVFLKSMQERNELAEVRVIFLDESPGATLTVNVGQSQDKAESNTTTKGSGNWATFVRTVPAKAFTGLSQGEHIMLEAQGGRIPLHMVEVVRKPAQ